MPRSRRIIVTVLALVILGAAANVLVATAFAVWVHFDFHARTGAISSTDPPCWSLVYWDRLGAARVYSRAYWNEPPTDRPVTKFRPYWSQTSSLPPSTPGTPLIVADRSGGTALIEDARGWPFLSMKSTFLPIGRSRPDGTEDSFPVSYGVQLRRVSPMGSFETPRAIPLRPIWLGFFLNTLIYGTLFATAYAIVDRLRRSYRLRRGQCPSCGYPIGSATQCSECGRALPTRTVA